MSRQNEEEKRKVFEELQQLKDRNSGLFGPEVLLIKKLESEIAEK